MVFDTYLDEKSSLSVCNTTRLPTDGAAAHSNEAVD
jgi:hypothetical protein